MATPWKVPSRGGAKGVGHLRSWQSRARLQVLQVFRSFIADYMRHMTALSMAGLGVDVFLVH